MLPFGVFYFYHLHHKHVGNFWTILRRWTNQTKRFQFLLIKYYFSSLENSEFSWIYSAEEKKMFTTTDKFHNHSKEMTSSSWEQFLLLSEIWGEKYHLFLSPNHKKMNDIILLPQELELYVLWRELCSHFQHRGSIMCSVVEKGKRKGGSHTTITGHGEHVF